MEIKCTTQPSQVNFYNLKTKIFSYVILFFAFLVKTQPLTDVFKIDVPKSFAKPTRKKTVGVSFSVMLAPHIIWPVQNLASDSLGLKKDTDKGVFVWVSYDI